MFDREYLIIGDKINILKQSNILLVGLGGVGGYTLESLARSGIESFTIVDFDKVDITNTNRQLIAIEPNYGLYKTDCWENRLKQINKNIKINKITEFLDENNINKIINKDTKYNFIIDCIDSVNSKKLLIEESIKYNIPIISSMGTGNKIDPSLLKINKLKKTETCPLAKKMRSLLRDNKEALEIPVLYSTEKVIKNEDINHHIGSISYLPAISGLLISSYVIRKIIGDLNE